ncbi:MAG: hypothetical protein CMC04_00655 [Flavobacteriaceae bacterium]|nr:hypothetical protein [Flavobacteriaceae bacterium]
MKPEIIISSILICFFSLYFFQKLFLKKGILDNINFRSSHTSEATRNGGIGIFLSVLSISIVFYLTGYEIFDYSILVPLTILITVGFYDDIYSVDFKLKFIFQIIFAKIIIDSGLIIDNLHGIFGINEINRVLAQLLSIFVITAIINAINFIDGIDGLSIFIISFFIIMFELLGIGNSPFFNLSLILISSFIPLLYFNFRKEKKIFLGDSGSLFLGGVTAIYVMHIFSSEYIINESYDINKIFYVMSLLIYPIIDISRVVLIRIFSGKSPFNADKNHIHHILLNFLNSHYKVSILLLIVSGINFLIIHFIF